MTVSMILMVLAFVLFLVASAGVSHPRVNFGWLGLASWVLSILIAGTIKV